MVALQLGERQLNGAMEVVDLLALDASLLFEALARFLQALADQALRGHNLNQITITLHALNRCGSAHVQLQSSTDFVKC